MKYQLIGILIAMVIVAAVAGPLAIVLWKSWRAVVVGGLLMSAVFLFFGSMLAAGGAAYNPSSGNPWRIVYVGWAIAALCLFLAYWLAGKGIKVKVLNVVVGVVVVGWTAATYHFLPLAWFAVTEPVELGKMIGEIREESKQQREGNKGPTR